MFQLFYTTPKGFKYPASVIRFETMYTAERMREAFEAAKPNMQFVIEEV